MGKKIAWTDPAKADLRAIDQPTALRILHIVARYLATGEGDVKRLQDVRTARVPSPRGRLPRPLPRSRRLHPGPRRKTPPRSLPLSCEHTPNEPRTQSRTDTGQSPDAHRTRHAFRQCPFRCAEGARDGVFPQITSPAPISFSHFFDGWKQHRSGEGDESRARSFARSSERSADP